MSGIFLFKKVKIFCIPKIIIYLCAKLKIDLTMRIINYKVKDYYDYLSGIYGIDNDITFDRKEPFIIHSNEMNYNQNLDMLFFKQKMCHEPLYYRCGKHIYSGKFNNKYCFVLEVGYKQYIFEVTRYLKNDDTLYFEPNY